MLNLYLYLHEETVPEQSEHLSVIWNQIIADKNHHLIVNIVDGKIVCLIGITLFGMGRNVYQWCAIVFFGRFGAPIYDCIDSIILVSDERVG